MKNYYLQGSWNVVCQSCGMQFKSDELRKRWDGLWVCEADFESRHPQEFLRVRPDRQSPPWLAPEPEDVFTNIPYISIYVMDGWVSPRYFEETL